MSEVIEIKTIASEAVEVITQGPQGPVGPKGDPGDVAGLPLTTTGDTLYRAANSTNARLPIGTSGQVLKVANGIPAWANESGAVTSVNGETGAVSLSAADVGAAAAAHTHDGTQVEIVADDATGPVLAAGFSEGSGVNGIYWPTDTTANALLVYKLNRTYGMFFEAGRWHIYELAPLSANIVVSSDLDDTDYPHQSNWPTGSVTKASLSNFGDNAAQQFRFVGDSMAVTDVTNAVSTSDSRLSDSRQPTLHGSSHHTGGTDAIAPNNIGAAWALETREHSFFTTSTYTLAQGRNVQLNASTSANNITATITLPRLTTDSAQNGDDLFISATGLGVGQTLIIQRYVWTGSSYIGSTETVVTTTTGGAWRFRLLSGVWTLQPVANHTHTGSEVNVGTTANLPLKTGTNGVVEAGSFGTAAGSFCAGDDARLSDDRDPNLHAASHAAGGSDPIEADDLAATGVAASSILISNGSGGTQWSGAGDQLTFDRFIATDGASADGTKILGDGIVFDDTTVQNTAWTGSVAASAVSGAITTSGLTQSTARILGRTTASTGAIEEIQIGSGLSLSAGQLSATASGGGEVRSDFVSPYTYTGLAAAGTSESAASWSIRRSEFDAGGSFVATLTASAVQWANRLTASYT